MLVIRDAIATDAPVIVEMIRELADFEQQLDHVEITPEDLLRDGFGENQHFHALVAEWNDQPVGYAVYFFTYSTWVGRAYLFVEDVFVRAAFRGKGIGRSLLQRMAAIAHEHRCHGMRWEVLHWNTAAIDFYRSFGADLQKEWFPVLLTGSEFEELASGKERAKS